PLPSLYGPAFALRQTRTRLGYYILYVFVLKTGIYKDNLGSFINQSLPDRILQHITFGLGIHSLPSPTVS
ncbi:MAG TPA: hypothetical protein VNV85_08575, partial [Puia sp.]|nr:hypothetical protein [Puia sp.]